MSTKKIQVSCQGAKTLDQSELVPFQGNLKSLSEENYQRLKKVILDHGFSEPISVWQNDGKNYIINGHQRLRTIRNMIEDGYECPNLPVSIVKAKSAKQAAQKVLALTSQYGKIEDDGLYEFMTKAELDPESLLTDYSFAEIDVPDFLDSYFKDETPDVDSELDDQIPEVEENELGVELGDLWQLGEHRLLCGDSTDKATVDILMNGEKADMVFTDPPYNLGGNTKCLGKDINKSVKNLSENDWDSDFNIKPALKNIGDVSTKSAPFYIFTSQFLAPVIWEWMDTRCEFYNFFGLV